MSYSYIEMTEAGNSSSGTSMTVAANYVEGETVVVCFGYDGNSIINETISDGTNSYSRVSATLSDSDTYNVGIYRSDNVAAGAYTITFTLDSAAGHRQVAAIRLQGIQGIALTAKQYQDFPTTSTDAVTSTSVTPDNVPAVLLGICISTLPTGIDAGTSFTDEGTMPNAYTANLTSARVEHQRLLSPSAVAATFTALAEADDMWSWAIVIPEGSELTTSKSGVPDRFA